MITKISTAAKAKLIDHITGARGLSDQLAALSDGGALEAPELIRTQNVAQDLIERSAAMRYPEMQVYCDKVVNRLTEKFRSFSGAAHMVIELRHSQDRIEGIEQVVETYVEAATGVLRSSRGDWGDGMFYGGAYEVSFGPVKRGGRHFIQAAKITFEIGVSKN